MKDKPPAIAASIPEAWTAMVREVIDRTAARFARTR
jgi:hypothetical protein